MLSIFPVSYFGNIEYFRQLVRAENPVIETKEHFIKQTVRTRCEILSTNGIQQLNIPVFRKNGSKTLMDEVELSTETDWQTNHWRSIKTAYSSSPYFEHYGMELEELIHQKERNLIQFNSTILKRIIDWLDLPLEIKYSKEYCEPLNAFDFRQNEFKMVADQKPYKQVFTEEGEFISNLSIIDLIFCEGPMARNFIMNN